MVAAADGWHAFDGTTLTALPSLRTERVGDFAQINRVGPLILLQPPNDVFGLDQTLTARPVADFPVAQPSSANVEIVHIAASGLFVVVERRSEQLHVSTDFTRCHAADAPVPDTGLAAPLPDRPGLLPVGSDGLYTFEADCPPKGD